MPTLQEIKNVFDIPADDGPAKARAILILRWYATHWLTACCTIQWFGTTVKPFFLATECPPKKDGSGPSNLPYVTVQSEAFGLTVFENCIRKWPNCYKWKDDHPKETLPKYDEVSCGVMVMLIVISLH